MDSQNEGRRSSVTPDNGSFVGSAPLPTSMRGDARIHIAEEDANSNLEFVLRADSTNSRPSFRVFEDLNDQASSEPSFDPAEMLNAGFQELHDRSLSIRFLKRNRSIVVPESVLRKSFRSEIQKESERKAFDYVIDEAPKDASGAPSLHEEALEPRSPFRKRTMAEYFSSLSSIPAASMMHVIMLYHETLLTHGLAEEAGNIAALLEGFQSVEKEDFEEELRGIDLLLKDGLLKLYLRIQPHLPPIPSQIVKFKSVSHSANVLVSNGGYETMLTKVLELVKLPLKNREKMKRVEVLNDVTGYLMPGTLTLVLGPPHCGKSALHGIIAGRIIPSNFPEGTVTYNGEDAHDLNIHRLAAAVGQKDLHYAFLTVRETLEFSRKYTSAFRSHHYGPELKQIMGEALSIGQDPGVELTLSITGLKRVAGRLVGVPLSLTDGEKHCLTAAEMFAGSYAVYLFDELNKNVEETVTYDLLTAIRIFARVRQITVMASLLQPSHAVFSMFDRLIVMDKGFIVYQGPREDALSYFETLGYKKPRHLEPGEFLQEVTTEQGIEYLQPGFRKLDIEDFVAAYKKSDMYKDICRIVDSPELQHEIWVQGKHPLGVHFLESKEKDSITNTECCPYTVSKLAEEGGSLLNISMDHTANIQPGDNLVAFKGHTGNFQYVKTEEFAGNSSEPLQSILQRLSEPVHLQLERPFQRVTRVLSKQFHIDYVLNMKSEVMSLAEREIKVTWRNKFGLYIRLFQVLALSLFGSFLMFRVKNDADQYDMNLLRTLFFISIMNMTMFNVGQLPVLMGERSIYYKQQGAHFFRPGSYLFGKILGSLPFSLAEGTIWTVIVYFISGLSLENGGWHFFVYYLIILLTVLNGASMVRFFSTFAPNSEKAGVFIGLFVALFIVFSGFLIPRFKVPKYWLWLYYIDPMQWGITALVINEYNSASYSQLCKDVVNIAAIPQCNGRPNNTIGHAYLARGQFYTSNHWIGIAVAVLIAWFLVWNGLSYLCFSKIRHEEPLRASPNLKNKISKEINREEGDYTITSLSYTALPITLSWHELRYDVTVPSLGKTSTILNYVSGWGDPGDMVAILGLQGSGKTTLLNCLAGRKVSMDQIGGQILVNGYLKAQKVFASYMGYVEDIDAYTPYMTVRETIAFSAKMRLSKASTPEKQSKFVEEILELLELKHIENSIVMSLKGSHNLEQARRIVIATELAANPSVLFLDEPTKDLHSWNAFRIVDCLKKIAATGRLVIVVLKHPSNRMIAEFSKVQILRQGGETVYFGSVGRDGETIWTYFETIPGTPVYTANRGLYSFVADLIGDGITSRNGTKDYAFEYRVSQLALQNHMHLQYLARSKGHVGPELLQKGFGASYGAMSLEVIRKIQRQYWRNVNYSWGRMTFYLVMGILLGSIFYKMEYHTNVGMNSRASSIFISCLLVGITNAQNVIPYVLVMRIVTRREKAANQFSALLYNIAWTLAEIPYLMVATLILCSVFLPMVNMAVDSAAHFFIYWFISFLFFLTVTYFGMFLAVVSPLPQVASALVPVIIGIWVATGGLVLPKRKILPQFIWLFWTNPLQYTLNSLTSIVFYCDINKAECLNNGLNPDCLNDLSQCPRCDCPRLHDTNNTFVWKQIQFSRSLDHGRVPFDMLALFIFIVFFRVLTFLSLKFMAHNKRA